MSFSKKSPEIDRLIRAFEIEADSFHDIEFRTYLCTQEGTQENRKFRSPNHAIMLWQYVGQLKTDSNKEHFYNNLSNSNLQWGVRGALLTQYGVIEGQATDKFMKMAMRAGSLFNKEETIAFKSRVINEILNGEIKNNPKSLPTAVVNDNPLAIWLNYLLFYLSLTHPNRENAIKIQPDLFTLSLLGLEQLASELTIQKSDKSNSDIAKIEFEVAVSFPGEKRKYVSRVVDVIRAELGNDKVFYDLDYQAQIARPNADILLQNIYHKQSKLIVVFLCEEYSKKEWCGLEWRGIRDLIKSKKDEKIMFVKFGKAELDGTFSIDGYIDGNKYKTQQVATYILQRLKAFKP